MHASVAKGSSKICRLKPPSYETEVIIAADGNFYGTSQENRMSGSLPVVYEQQLPTKDDGNNTSSPQSQESAFKGFSESPYGKLQRQFFPSTSSDSLENVSTNVSSENKNSRTKGNTVFTRFYDMVVEENSCNAVDMQLSNEAKPPTVVCKQKESQENGVDYLLSICKKLEPQMPTMLSRPFRLSIELSFNGKIKSLTPPSEDEEANIEISKKPENQSFILKKDSNTKSPDLFGDDDEDDDNYDYNDNANTVNEIDNGLNTSALIEIVPYTSNQADDSFLTQSKVKGLQEEIGTSVDEVSEKNIEVYADTSTNKSRNILDSERAGDKTCEPEPKQIGRHTDAYSLFRENCRREKELLKRTRKCLAGIPPPPSVTIPQLDMFSAVIERKQDILEFSNDFVAVSEQCVINTSIKFKSLFKPTHSIDEAKEMGWRQVLGVRQHGFCFNLCKASENNEYLGLSVIERFIGAETASSYRNSPSSAKKRNARMKLLTQSPGNRLSHLARRRATFSSVQLANQKSNNLHGPQILMNVKNKKIKHRRKNTPKRLTPGSKKKTRKTPSSSARKRLFRCDLIKTGPSREASKRALFQSPAKQLAQKTTFQKMMPSIKPEIANRVEKSKRALFSPETVNPNDPISDRKSNSIQQSSRLSTTQFESILKRKRSAIDDDDTGDSTGLPSQSSNLFRGGAENLTPRALKIKSQSFCIGASSSSATTIDFSAMISTGMPNAAVDSNCDLMAIRNSALSSSNVTVNSANPSTNSIASAVTGGKMQRAHSDMVAQTNTLTENQRKKLLWAVSQALQEKKITTKHESFKQYAAVLARVVRRIFQEFFQKSSTSNSETLLRLAKRYVHFVISGRCADEIYLQAKTKITRERNESSCRLTGYIGPEEYQRFKSSRQQLMQDDQINLFSQNSFCSGSIPNSHAANPTTMESYRNSNETEVLPNATDFKSHCQTQYELIEITSTPSSSLKKLSTQPNGSLQNSSSKNNMCGLALRENVNFESDQRRSAQKNFTGKDQRNVSPYANNTHSYNNNNQLKTNNNNQSSALRCTNSAGITQIQTKNVESTSLLHLCTKVKRQISFDN
ncbi:serine-rich adhesin for platelets isoform X2 [Eurosta solidaginis]|uniref:serine-rich adhesin for platelets isoform X2 n=1 Tax=Eurosta solidaginis TaxID=178769 RepID=UPI0035312FBA